MVCQRKTNRAESASRVSCDFAVLIGSVADDPAIVHRRAPGVLLSDHDPVFGLLVDRFGHRPERELPEQSARRRSQYCLVVLPRTSNDRLGDVVRRFRELRFDVLDPREDALCGFEDRLPVLPALGSRVLAEEVDDVDLCVGGERERTGSVGGESGVWSTAGRQ